MPRIIDISLENILSVFVAYEMRNNVRLKKNKLLIMKALRLLF